MDGERWRKLCGNVFFLLLTSTVASVLLGWNIGREPLENDDESLYAQTAAEMAESGNLAGWFLPRFNDQLFLDKPPLYYWMAALGYKLLGVSESAARLPSVISGLIVVLLVYYLSLKCSSKVTALLAVCVLLSYPDFTLHAQKGLMDAPLTLFFALALPLTMNRAILSLGICLGLALLVKGAGAAPLAVTIAVAGIWPRFLSVKSVLACLIAALSIALPWYLIITWSIGWEFWKYHVGLHVLDLASRPFVHSDSHWWFYIGCLSRRFFPWCCLIPILAWETMFRPSTESRSRDLRSLLGVQAFVVYVLYSVAATRVDRYIMPAAPALSILVAEFCVRWFRGRWLVLLFTMVIVSWVRLFTVYEVIRPASDPTELRPFLAAREMNGPVFICGANRYFTRFYVQKRVLTVMGLDRLARFALYFDHPLIAIFKMEELRRVESLGWDVKVVSQSADFSLVHVMPMSSPHGMGSLGGRAVHRETGAPVLRGQLVLTREGNVIADDWIRDGFYAFGPLQPGEYNISVSAPGCQDLDVQVNVGQGRNTLDLDMLQSGHLEHSPQSQRCTESAGDSAPPDDAAERETHE